MNLPVWAWVVFSVIAFITLMVFAAIRFRRRVRGEFLAYLAEHRPGVEVGEISIAFARVRFGPGEDWVTVNFIELYQSAAQLRSINPKDREPLYEDLAQRLGSSRVANLAQAEPGDAARLMPRLVTRDFFDVPPEKSHVPHVPLGETGIYVVYLLEGSQNAVYVTREHQLQMHLKDAELIEKAMENLRARSGSLGESVRRAIALKTPVWVKHFDGFDAARILLVPEHLETGEMLIAAIPDRETLVLVMQPEEGGYEGLAPLLLTTSEKRVFGGLLKVTGDGVELA